MVSQLNSPLKDTKDTLQQLKSISSRLSYEARAVDQLINHEISKSADADKRTWSQAERIEQLESILQHIDDAVDCIKRTM